MFLVISLLLALVLWVIFDKREYREYPPGPLRFPLFGNLFQLARYSFPYTAFSALAKKYGDVVYVRIGMSGVVTFNSMETVRDILSHENTVDRAQTFVPMIWERMFRKNLGLIFSNEKEWQTLRRFTIRTLRDFGFGKAVCMDVVINEEVEKFTEHLNQLCKENPNGVQGRGLFDLSIVNVLWRLVTGVKYELNDKNMLRLLQLSHKVADTASFAMDFGIAFPALYHLFPSWSGKKGQMQALDEINDFLKESVKFHRDLGDYNTSPKCYVDEFLAKIEQNKGKPDTEYTDEQLILCLLDLFQAGNETTSYTLSFCMLYMAIHQDIQAKVQGEIDANVLKGECIMLDTKDRLPYTFATLLECTRHASVIPIPGARQATKDFYYNGYLIKKGITLMANIQGVNFSEKLWGDPNNFRPSRFLTEEGEVDMKIANYLMPFGHGSRKCLAASLAENSLFIYFTSVLRGFNIKRNEKGEYSTVPDLGIAQAPKPYIVQFLPRT